MRQEPPIWPQHKKILSRLRIPEGMMREAQIESVTDSEARERLGIGNRSGDFSGLLFPYLDPKTDRVRGHRIRLDNPPAEQNGKGKYYMEQGCRELYFAPGTPDDLQDATIPVVLVEAEKSALAISAFAVRRKGKLVCVAVGGVWGWKRKDGIETVPDGRREATTGPSPSLDLLAWVDRNVYLLLDSNVEGRGDLEFARRALAQDLRKRGARVLIATVPKLDGVNGPDDLISVAGDDAMLEALNGAAEEKSGFRADEAIAQAERALAALEADKKGEPTQVIGAIAAVSDSARRELLAARLAALKQPGVNLKFIRQEVRRHRDEAETERKEAAATSERSRLLAIGATIRGAELLDKVCRFIRRFVLLSHEQADLTVLWIAHTHAFDAADNTPYLSINSPEKRSGKSRLLELLNALVARPWLTGRVSAAVLPRKIELDQSTLLLDESDAALNGKEEYSEVLRGILNMGHRRGGVTTVCIKIDGNFVPHDFSTFCPKAIAGIGKLPDTIADRSIPIRMKRKTKNEEVDRFRLRDEQTKSEAAQLGEHLAAYCAVNIEKLRDARPELPKALSDRQQDGAEPLLAIADLAGGEWPEKARRALIQLCAEAQASDDSISARLLSDIRTIFEARGVDRLPSAELADALAEIETSPWAEWSHGKPISPPKVARLLQLYKIAPHNIRTKEGKVLKGYEPEDFADAWARYLPSDAPPTLDSELSSRYTATARINTRENADFVTATEAPRSGSENTQIASKNASCSGVAVSSSEIAQSGREEEL